MGFLMQIYVFITGIAFVAKQILRLQSANSTAVHLRALTRALHTYRRHAKPSDEEMRAALSTFNEKGTSSQSPSLFFLFFLRSVAFAGKELTNIQKPNKCRNLFGRF
jgi:hypothetical protein